MESGVPIFRQVTNKMHNRKPNRLSGYDYSQGGYYFVTVCTHDRTEWFGRVENGNVQLNKYGEIAKDRWMWLGEQYPYAILDEYVVMPNHFHGIVGINVGNGRDRSLHKIKPLSELIGAFKTTSSKMIHQLGLIDFHWQKSFYDHVIRDEASLNRIREYIINNPLQWDYDIENTGNPRNDVRADYNRIVGYV